MSPYLSHCPLQKTKVCVSLAISEKFPYNLVSYIRLHSLYNIITTYQKEREEVEELREEKTNRTKNHFPPPFSDNPSLHSSNSFIQQPSLFSFFITILLVKNPKKKNTCQRNIHPLHPTTQDTITRTANNTQQPNLPPPRNQILAEPAHESHNKFSRKKHASPVTQPRLQLRSPLAISHPTANHRAKLLSKPSCIT